MKIYRIISTVNSRVLKATHTYDIEVSTYVEHSNQIDGRIGNCACKYAINNEMKNVPIYFEILNRKNPIPVR